MSEIINKDKLIVYIINAKTLLVKKGFASYYLRTSYDGLERDIPLQSKSIFICT